MSKYAAYYHPATATVYFHIQRLSDGYVLVSTDHAQGLEGEWVSYLTANYTSYVWEMTASGESYLYRRELPGYLSAGQDYMIIVFVAATLGAPASTDPVFTTFGGIWNGSDLLAGTYNFELADLMGTGGSTSTTFPDLVASVSDLQIQVAQLQREIEELGIGV